MKLGKRKNYKIESDFSKHYSLKFRQGKGFPYIVSLIGFHKRNLTKSSCCIHTLYM